MPIIHETKQQITQKTDTKGHNHRSYPSIEQVKKAVQFIPLHSFDRGKQQAITAALVNNGLEEVARESLLMFRTEKQANDRIRDAGKMRSDSLWGVINTAKQHGFKLSRDTAPPVYAAQNSEAKRAKKAKDESDRIDRFNRFSRAHDSLKDFNPSEGSYLYRKLGERVITAITLGMTSGIKQGRGFISYRLGGGCIQRIYDKKTKGLSQKTIASLPDQCSGSYKLIGNHFSGGSIYLAEGLATALTVALTGRVAAVCLSSTNIAAAARKLRSDYPDARLMVAADNDSNKSGEQAAIKAGLAYTMPEKVGDDWNDVFQRDGLKAVRDGMARLRFAGEVAANERYIGIDSGFSIQTGAVNVLKSTMGTGKTVAIKNHVEASDKKTVIVCKLRSLTRSIAESVGAVLYEDFKGTNDLGTMLKTAPIIAVTPESLYMLDGVTPETLIVDECEQTLKYWTNTETMRGQNKPNIDRLNYMAANAETVVLADAHAGTGTNLFIDAINDSERPVVRYTNLFRHEGRTAKQISTNGEAYDMVRADLQSGKKLFIPCTSRVEAKEIHSLCEKMGKSAVAIHGENSGDPETQDFIKQVNDGRCHSIDALIVSPAAGTGLSVDNHSFTKTIGIFKVIKGLTVNDTAQMLNRVRNVSDYAVFAGHQNSQFEECPEVIEQLIRDKVEETVSESGFNGQVQYCELLLKLDCLTKSEENKSANNFNSLFWDSMLEDGYTLSFTGKDEVSEKNGKKIKEEMKNLNNAEIEKALPAVELLTDEQLEKADKGSIAAVKTLSHKLLPEYEELDRFTLQAAKNPRLVYNLKYNYRLAEMSLKDAREADSKELSEFKGFHGELNHITIQKKKMARIFRFAGIDPVTYEHDGTTWTSSDEKQVKAIRQIIDRSKDLNARKIKEPVKWLNAQLEKYGFGVGCDTVDKAAEDGREKVRTYTIRGKNLLREIKRCDPIKSSEN